MKNNIILFISSLILFCSCTNNEPTQEISMEWLYSDAGKSIGAIYRSEWIDNNLLYLMDMREPKESRTILTLVPIEVFLINFSKVKKISGAISLYFFPFIKG